MKNPEIQNSDKFRKLNRDLRQIGYKRHQKRDAPTAVHYTKYDYNNGYRYHFIVNPETLCFETLHKDELLGNGRHRAIQLSSGDPDLHNEWEVVTTNIAPYWTPHQDFGPEEGIPLVLKAAAAVVAGAFGYKFLKDKKACPVP